MKTEDLKNISTAMAAVAVPVTVAIIGSYYSSQSKSQEVGVKFVEIAVAILEKQPNKDDESVRRWAVDILGKYSGVPLDQQAKTDIVDRVPLPQILENLVPYGSKLSTIRRKIANIIVRDSGEEDVNAEMKGLEQAQAAYHYLITKEGLIFRLVNENDVAYHTAGHNADTIGIGLTHISKTDYPQKQQDSLKILIADICARNHLKKEDVLSAHDVDPTKNSDLNLIKSLCDCWMQVSLCNYKPSPLLVICHQNGRLPSGERI